MNFLRIFLPYMLMFPVIALAQNGSAKPVQDSELRACLLAEQEGVKRFNQLESRATEIRGTEKLLTERRTALQEMQRNMDRRTARQSEVDELNNMVTVFNQQTDQLNADRQQFEQDVNSNRNWMDNNIKPRCEPIRNRPVDELTAFYACGHHSALAYVDVPYCNSLPGIDSLKSCVAKAGTRQKALEMCGNR
ncbi:MAG TPA: hypothetical protein VFV28_04160 [Limnobacter sp.]|nr:hypothetical protein [Limnobacter sp.]